MSSTTPPQDTFSKGAIDWIGLLLLLPPPLFWAGNFIVGRAMHDTVPPMAMSLWRWVIALTLVLPFAAPAMRRDFPKYWQHRWRVLGVSLAGVFAFNALVYIGLQSTTASNALLLNSFIPILVVLIAGVFYRQRIRGVQALGLALSFAGVVTILVHGEWTRLATLSFSRGDLVVFCATVSWALYTVWLRGVPAEIDRIGFLGAQIVIALFILIPLCLWEWMCGSVPTWNLQSIGALIYLGVFPSFIAYLLYNLAVARVGAAQAGMSIHLIPLFGVLLAALLLSETIHGYHAVGIIAIIAGITCASVPDHRASGRNNRR